MNISFATLGLSILKSKLLLSKLSYNSILNTQGDNLFSSTYSLLIFYNSINSLSDSTIDDDKLGS